MFSNHSLTVVSLSRLTPGLSGVYTCKVSTNTQETVSRARLQILSKSESNINELKSGKLAQFKAVSDIILQLYHILSRCE